MSGDLLIADQVRATVQGFWLAFAAKAAERMSEFYDSRATVWSSTADRIEPGRLAVIRRCREYLIARGDLRASVKGPIEVGLFGNVAIASYAFEFCADKVSGASRQVIQERITCGRATQVFCRQDGNEFRIIHEHFSVAANGEGA